jgi:hypothetical protein
MWSKRATERSLVRLRCVIICAVGTLIWVCSPLPSHHSKRFSQSDVRPREQLSTYQADGRANFNVWENPVRRLPDIGSSEWQNFVESFIPSISGPVRRSVGLVWYEYRNLCINDQDTFRCRQEDFSRTQKDLERLNLSNVQLPYRTSAINWAEFQSSNTYILSGKSLLVQCWRASETSSPSHFLFGYGKLFALINDDEGKERFDNVVFFQCPTPFIGNQDDFFHSVWQIVYRVGFNKGWFTKLTRFYTTSQQNSNHNLCIRSALLDFSVGLSFGLNWNRSIVAWKKALADYVPSKYQKLESTMYVESTLFNFEECSDNLRIAIFVRNEGRVGLRRFLNFDDVFNLAASFTARPVNIMSIGSDDSFMRAVELMNSYDILITPHGSHLTNALLNLRKLRKPSIIEVVSTCYNTDFKRNLEPSFAFFEISSGHKVPDTSLQRDIDVCERRSECVSNPECPFDVVERAKHSDLLVNLSKLETAMQTAVSQQCRRKF